MRLYYDIDDNHVAYRLVCDGCTLDYGEISCELFHYVLDAYSEHHAITLYTYNVDSIAKVSQLPCVDVYAYVRKRFAHDSAYIAWCKRNMQYTRTKRPKLTFETVYRYVTKDRGFAQTHNANDDVDDLVTLVSRLGI